MDPQAARHPIPDDNPVTTDDNESIKSLSQEATQHKKEIVITRCLCNPCPIYYTDAISESILIRCNDPKHSSFDGQTSYIEEKVKD